MKPHPLADNGAAPALLAPQEIVQAVREYRMRRQRATMPPPDPRNPVWNRRPPTPFSLWSDLDCIAYLVFAGESVAHIHGREKDLLPVTERVRDWLAQWPAEITDLRELGQAVIDGRVSLDAALVRAHQIGRDEQKAHEAATADRE